MKVKQSKQSKITAVILAGGLGTRMLSDISDNPKALMPILEKPMIYYVISAVLKIKEDKRNKNKIDRIIVVIGHKGERVKDYILNENDKAFSESRIDFVVQKEYAGTADAARQVLPLLGPAGKDDGDILILPCDTPLITYQTLKGFAEFHSATFNDLSILSFKTKDPFSYGRLLKDDNGFVKAIVEEKELVNYSGTSIRSIKDVNAGIYLVKKDHFKELVGLIQPDNLKKEYYLTDLAGIFYQHGLKVKCYCFMEGQEELMGVNSWIELLTARQIMQKRFICKMAENGVNFVTADNIYIGASVKVHEGAVIYPGCFISGSSVIGKNAVIESGSVIRNSIIGEDSIIKSYSVLEDVFVENGASVGPFGRLRQGTVIKSGAKIGNFVEVKNSVIGENSKAQHLSYVGDSQVGKDVNIGAGVITCNYDGIKKHRTVIGDGCFIGSDSQLVAPVVIEKNSYVASGTTVTKNVPEGNLAISRAPQENKKGWVLKRLKKIKNKE